MKLLAPSEPTRFPNSEVKNSRKSRQIRSLKDIKSKGRMAALEKLPTELLLHIFFYSLNLNLPRASPIIASKLSDEHTFIEAITMVFEPSWECHYEYIYGIRKGETPWPCTGDPNLQVCLRRPVKHSRLWRANSLPFYAVVVPLWRGWEKRKICGFSMLLLKGLQGPWVSLYYCVGRRSSPY